MYNRTAFANIFWGRNKNRVHMASRAHQDPQKGQGLAIQRHNQPMEIMKWGHIALSRMALLSICSQAARQRRYPSRASLVCEQGLSSCTRKLSCYLCSKTQLMDRPLKCLRVSKAPVCQPETLKPARVRRAKERKPGATVSQEHHDQSAFEGAHASPAIQEHATAADLTKVLEKVTKNTVRDVIKEIKPLFKLGTVKKTKNAKQDDGAINKIRDKLDQQAKSLDAAAAAINKLTDKLNNTHEKSDLESGSASENSSEDEKDFEKRCCNFCAVLSSYYFGPVSLPPISSVPTPISSVPTHQELMHQQMQASPASVLGQAQVCPSCRSTFQHPTVPQFSYSFPVPLPSYSGGTIYQTPPHPVTHSHAEKKKKKAYSSKRCIALKGRKKFTMLTNLYPSFPDPDLFVILLNEIRSLK
eukprot:g460.t1